MPAASTLNLEMSCCMRAAGDAEGAVCTALWQRLMIRVMGAGDLALPGHNIMGNAVSLARIRAWQALTVLSSSCAAAPAPDGDAPDQDAAFPALWASLEVPPHTLKEIKCQGSLLPMAGLGRAAVRAAGSMDAALLSDDEGMEGVTICAWP